MFIQYLKVRMGVTVLLNSQKDRVCNLLGHCQCDMQFLYEKEERNNALTYFLRGRGIIEILCAVSCVLQ